MTLPDQTSATHAPKAFARSLPLALLKAREAVTVRLRPVLRQHGLTEQQWRVMRVLWAAEKRLRPMELSQLTFISMPSLSRLLRTLEGRQFIKRARHVGDQRGAEFALTPAGRGIVEQIVPQFESIYGQIESLLGDAQSEQLFRSLEHVVLSLGLPGEDELD